MTPRPFETDERGASVGGITVPIGAVLDGGWGEVVTWDLIGEPMTVTPTSWVEMAGLVFNGVRLTITPVAWVEMGVQDA